MNINNRRKTLSVYPDIKELEYSSKLDTATLNGQLRSIEESALRALLRSRELTSELDRIELGVVKSYQAMANKYNSLNYESASTAYASSFNVEGANKTTAGNVLYDESYGLITLNPIGSYSKIPRGMKYDGKVSPQVTMYLDGTEIPCTSESEAMAIAAGAWMAGEESEVYMQNSGLGHIVDVVTSLYKPYNIPLPKLLLSVRHSPEHHKYMFKCTTQLLELLEYDDVEFVVQK